jgi:hypothetical protein
VRVFVALAVLLSVVVGPSAIADDDPDITGGTTTGGLFATGTKSKTPPPPRGPHPSAHETPADPHITIGQAACPGAAPVVGSSDPAVFCNANDEQPVLTVADVHKAFKELKLDPGTLVIQPPDGLTLVNFKTNFYTTTTTPTTLTVTLLDQPVTIEATPATYTWHFGDGETTSTTDPGAAYPKLTITHDYKLKGDYLPSLSTTYTGRYKVADGPWQTIPGTVTIDGPAQNLRAIEAQPKLVGY